MSGTPAVLGVGSAAALLAGAGACLSLPALPPLFLLWGLGITGVCGWLWPWRGRWAGVLLFGFAWAGLQAGGAMALRIPPELELRPLTLTGTVAELPQHDARRTRFLFVVEEGQGAAAELRGRRVMLSWHDEHGAQHPGARLKLRAGERWRFEAKLRAPRGLRNPGGFDSQKHALLQRIGATGNLYRPERAARLSPAAGVDAWREEMSARIGQTIATPSSRFVRALALGDTRGLTQEDWHVLRATGLTHLIAISGFHVGLVASAFGVLIGGLWRLFPDWARCLPRPQAMGIAAVLAALGYAVLAGFALPTVRTVLMMAVWAAARLGRRPARVVDTLALALAAVLLFDPLSPLAAGFWLSFGGVAWLAWCLPATGAQHWLRGFLSAQAVATVGLLPLTVVLFDQASLAGPLANLVAIPWWSLVVVPLSLLGTAAEALVPGAGTWPWQWAAACFDLTWPGFRWLADSRFSLWWLPEAAPWAAGMAMAGAFWLLLPRGVPGKPLAALLWLPLLWPDRGLPRRGEVELAMIDVGQGLSVLVRTARHALLYDMGPATRGGFDAGERAVVPALRAWGVPRLDRVVVSHDDNDHVGGLASVLRTLPAGVAQAPPGQGAALEAALPAPRASQEVPVLRHCLAGERWEWDGVRFGFLHPHPHFPNLGNESSCVLRIETDHGAALLTGDIGEVIERELVRKSPLQVRAEVVFAPHHGSAGSSDPRFVAATGARLVLVSSGHRNRFGHPRPQVVARWQAAGAEVVDTAGSGAVQVWLSPDGLALRERRHARPRLWDAARR
ncbi:DNA internalization-related competence protein ComEC/Rec2 [Pseudoxanthomonas beigongshangi]